MTLLNIETLSKDSTVSQNEEIKKIIIVSCKDEIEDLSEFELDELDDPDFLQEVWETVKDNSDQFNNIVSFVILNLDDFNESTEDEFIFVSKISKTTLNVDSIPFFNETSNTCLLYYDDEREEIVDAQSSILYKVVLDNFTSISSISNNEVGIFQKKHANELCLDDLKSYSKVLLTNIGLSIKDDILITKNKYLDSKELTCNKNYLQYKDSIDILNEYNNTTDVLWKFLLLYQILENFSYRKSIAENLRSTTSLNIKHLSNIYTDPKGEGQVIMGSIQGFIKGINDSLFFEDVSTTIKVELTTEGNAKKVLLENIDTTVKDTASFLHIKLQEIHNKKITAQELSKIIYVIRNCIVHNKETEWIHINSSLLKEKPEIKDFFEYFLLPTMEFIVKELIFVVNDITDYPSDKPNYILVWGNQPSGSVNSLPSVEFNCEQNTPSITSIVSLLASQVGQRVLSLFRRK